MGEVKEKAERVGDNAALKALARTGLVAYGLIYLLIGWLSLQLAWGGHSKSPDPSGAFRTLGEQPWGRVLLTMIAVVLVALGVWKASEVLWGHRQLDGLERLRERARSGFWAAVYAGLGTRAAWVALGPGERSSGPSPRAAVGVLSWPGGRALVVAAGLVVVGAGVAAAAKGIRKSFSDDIDASRLSSAGRERVLLLGQVGWLTKGIAWFLVGGLLVYAAWTFDWRKTAGLDAALKTILEQPFGSWMLSVMALGFLSFGLYAALQFRYRRM